MKYWRHASIAITTFTLFTGCLNIGQIIQLASQPRFKDVPRKQKLFDMKYYSIAPPQGENWMYLIQDKSIIFKKFLGSYHTLFFSVTQKTLPDNFKSPKEYNDWMKIALSANTDPERYKNTISDIRLDNRFGEYCIKYDIKSEDHKLPIVIPSKFMIIHDQGYIFKYDTANPLYFDIRKLLKTHD